MSHLQWAYSWNSGILCSSRKRSGMSEKMQLTRWFNFSRSNWYLSACQLQEKIQWKKKISKGVHLVCLFVCFFKQTSVVYKKGRIELLPCHVAAKIKAYWVQKTRCVIWKSEKKIKELQFKKNLIFLAKILHILSTHDYLK